MNSYAAEIIAKDHIRSIQREAADSRRAPSSLARGRVAGLAMRTLARVFRAAHGRVAGPLPLDVRSPKVHPVGRS